MNIAETNAALAKRIAADEAVYFEHLMKNPNITEKSARRVAAEYACMNRAARRRAFKKRGQR